MVPPAVASRRRAGMLLTLLLTLTLGSASATAAAGAGVVGAASEIGHFEQWLTCGLRPDKPCGLAARQRPGFTAMLREDVKWRAVPRAPVSRELCELIVRGRHNRTHAEERPRILDVGAGPLSTVGTHCGETPVELVPIDVLAPVYDGLVRRATARPHRARPRA